MAHSTLRMRWSYPKPDTPAIALAASSLLWKLMKANPYKAVKKAREMKKSFFFTSYKTNFQGFLITIFSKDWNLVFHLIPDNLMYLRLASIFIFCQVDSLNGSKWSEQFLQVGLSSIFRQVGNTDGGWLIYKRNHKIF